MSGLKALDKLRKLKKEVVDYRWGVDFDRAVDELEAEIDERFMELPVDADGVLIHLGDMMEGVNKYDTLCNVKGEVIEVSYIATDNEGLVASVALKVRGADGKSWHRSYLDPYAAVYRHVEPRTVEDVLRDVMQFGHDDNTVGDRADDVVDKYAAEIRELMEVDE